jgi:hypothetical protein
VAFKLAVSLLEDRVDRFGFSPSFKDRSKWKTQVGSGPRNAGTNGPWAKTKFSDLILES